MPHSIFALFYLLPRLYNKDSWSLSRKIFSALEGCFDPDWRITLETKANKKLSHFRTDRGVIMLEQKIRSRPTLDSKVLSSTCETNILHTKLTSIENILGFEEFTNVFLSCFSFRSRYKTIRRPKQTREKIFSLLESEWQHERLSYLDFPAPPSVWNQ